MMLVVCFDLPRNNKNLRKQAEKFRKRLIALGFTMKQYSIYEREVKKTNTIKRVVEKVTNEIPEYGKITMYTLSDEINNNQIEILGKNYIKITSKNPSLVVL